MRTIFSGPMAVLLLAASLLSAPSAAAQNGGQLFGALCSGCHNDIAHPLGLVYNAAGNVDIITTVNGLGMGAGGTLADHTAIATYLDQIKPVISMVPVKHDSPGTAIPLRDIIVSAADTHAFLKVIEKIETVTPPTKGTVTYGYALGFGQPSNVIYTPFPGQSGVDTWTYRGTGAAGNTTVRTASVVIAEGTTTAPDLNQHGLTGFWFNPASSGQGIAVEVAPNTSPGSGFTFTSWFTYDTVAGGPEKQRWYSAQGQIVGGQSSAALTIYQNTGGNFNAPPVTTATPVGTATLRFDTCTSGQLAYAFTDGSNLTGTIPLSRLSQNVTCSTTTPHPVNADFALTGNWFGGAATSGQGLTIEVNPVTGVLFAAWYTYVPNGVAAGAAGQRWYTAQGAFTPGLRAIPVTLYATTGGVFNAATPPGQHTDPVGTGTITFQSCTTATFAYSFTAGTSAGAAGTINLSRLGPVPPGCTS